MHLVNLTTAGLKRFVGISFAFFTYSIAIAQENSPYSRYGLGDVVPNQNIVNRGMGGIAAGYSDQRTDDALKLPKPGLSINFKNPASLGSLTSTKSFSNTLFDIGGEVDIKTLKSTNTTDKYKATNTLISYIQIAFPIATRKMERKGINWGLSFGLRPITRISYKIEQNQHLAGIDSLNTLYEGSGGLNQVNVSTGFKIKNFSIGVSSGYSFGNKDYSTQKVFVNDSVAYYKSNLQTQASYGGVFLNTGIQYMIPIQKLGFFKLGAYLNLQQNLKATEDLVNETFVFDGNGGIVGVDTITSTVGKKGTVKLPATLGVGFTYQDQGNNWLLGADFEMTNWSKYKYYDKVESVDDSWTIRLGAEYYPAKASTASNKYWRFVKYRAGVYFGPDYIKIDKTRNNYAATLGASFPLTSFRFLRSGDFVQLNTAIEAGGRGNKESISFRETNLRFNIGISMNAYWFQKRSYQ